MWNIKLKIENLKRNYNDDIAYFGVDIFINSGTDELVFKNFEDELKIDGDYDGWEFDACNGDSTKIYRFLMAKFHIGGSFIIKYEF